MKSISFFLYFGQIWGWLHRESLTKMGSKTGRKNFFDLVDRLLLFCLRAKIVTILNNNKFAILNNKIKTSKLLWTKIHFKNARLLMIKALLTYMYRGVSRNTNICYQSSPSLLLREPLIHLWCGMILKFW